MGTPASHLRGAAGKVAGGAAAFHAGKAFEARIDLLCRNSAVAIQSLPKCGGRFIGPGKMIHEEIPCDFVGCVRASGRAVFFDAKSSDGYALAVGNDRIVKDHQRAFLSAMAEAGALAGLLVEAKKAGKYLWLRGSLLTKWKSLRWDHGIWIDLGAIGESIHWERLISTREG